MSSDDDFYGGYSDEDEEDEMMFAEEETTTTSGNVGGSGTTTSNNLEYRVIAAEDIKTEQTLIINEIVDLFGLTPDISAALLRNYGWSKEVLIEKYYANTKLVVDTSGVTNAVGLHNKTLPPSPGAKQVTCRICYDNFPYGQTSGLACGHRFCHECWEPYLKYKVLEGSTCIFTACPMEECSEIVPESTFEKMLTKDINMKYQKFLIESYVDINRMIKWCPGQNCGKAVQGTGAATEVKCNCGTAFCFKCGEESHFPITCKEKNEWLDRCGTQGGNAQWILENTKKCPKCMTRIEKNQGCNKVGCKQCGHAFCWICQGPWSEHGSGNYYGCNKYKKKGDGKENNASADKSSTNNGGEEGENDRFLHYYKRYTAHEQAIKFAKKQINRAEEIVSDLRSKGKSSKWIDDGQFYKDAAKLVYDCRLVLKYTYVFAYNLSLGNAKDLFEYMQSNLESNVESLSEMSEKDINELNRENVINFCSTTKTLKGNLLQGVTKGLDSTAYNRILRFNQPQTAAATNVAKVGSGTMNKPAVSNAKSKSSTISKKKIIPAKKSTSLSSSNISKRKKKNRMGL
jgi:ariadne-1